MWGKLSALIVGLFLKLMPVPCVALVVTNQSLPMLMLWGVSVSLIDLMRELSSCLSSLSKLQASRIGIITSLSLLLIAFLTQVILSVPSGVAHTAVPGKAI